jgi:hypothetical protein
VAVAVTMTQSPGHIVTPCVCSLLGASLGQLTGKSASMQDLKNGYKRLLASNGGRRLSSI